jgi:hypothetical protein
MQGLPPMTAGSKLMRSNCAIDLLPVLAVEMMVVPTSWWAPCSSHATNLAEVLPDGCPAAATRYRRCIESVQIANDRVIVAVAQYGVNHLAGASSRVVRIQVAHRPADWATGQIVCPCWCTVKGGQAAHGTRRCGCLRHAREPLGSPGHRHAAVMVPAMLRRFGGGEPACSGSSRPVCRLRGRRVAAHPWSPRGSRTGTTAAASTGPPRAA